jgi:Trk-type K+ transport system membrane component
LNPRVIIRVNAGVILAIGLALLVPLALSLLYRDGSWASFLLPVTLMFAAGIVGIRATRPRGRAPEYVSNRDVVPETVRIAVLGLFAAWIGVFRHSDVHRSSPGELTPLSSSVTAVAATLNDVDPGLGRVGATESYEIVDPLGRFVLIACMLLGRLEIFTVLALLSPAFWRR